MKYGKIRRQNKLKNKINTKNIKNINLFRISIKTKSVNAFSLLLLLLVAILPGTDSALFNIVFVVVGVVSILAAESFVSTNLLLTNADLLLCSESKFRVSLVPLESFESFAF